MNPTLPPSVNYHLWPTCNMHCRFCFAGFADALGRLPGGHLLEADCHRLNRELAAHFEKISYVGGEPTLCPWLLELVREASHAGATTMLVTNGSRLTAPYLERLEGYLNWVSLSVDSANPEIHRLLGRAKADGPLPTEHYLEAARCAHALGMRLKLNTVVTALNHQEDLSPWVVAAAPERWKIFQVLPIEGENLLEMPSLEVTAAQFEDFVERHRWLEAKGVSLAPETNEMMVGSYAMIDPAGRFYDNTKGRLVYSAPILEVGLEEAWSQVCFSAERFRERGGLYRWASEKCPSPSLSDRPFADHYG